jgi:hypothetical protein
MLGCSGRAELRGLVPGVGRAIDRRYVVPRTGVSGTVRPPWKSLNRASVLGEVAKRGQHVRSDATC